MFRLVAKSLFSLCPFLVVASLSGYGQSPTSSPTTDPNAAELQKLKEELELIKQISTLKKDIAQAEADRVTNEKNRILNVLPQPTATPLTGAATITNYTFENEILAYRALGEVTRKIVDRLALPPRGNLVIYNDADLRAMETYLVISSQMRGYNDSYQNYLPRVEAAAASALLGPQMTSVFLRSVVDLLALFRTDVKTEGLSITVDDQALIARLGAELSDKVALYDPNLLLPNTLAADKLESSVLDQLNILQHARALADEVTISDELTKQRLAALNKEVDRFLTALMQVDPQTKRSPLASLFRAEKIRSLLPQKNDNQPALHFLYVKVVKAGGSHTIKSNLFRGTKVTEAGGVIVTYTLINSGGSIKSSGVCYALIKAGSVSAEKYESVVDCR